jgi:hypothetical protein
MFNEILDEFEFESVEEVFAELDHRDRIDWYCGGCPYLKHNPEFPDEPATVECVGWSLSACQAAEPFEMYLNGITES